MPNASTIGELIEGVDPRTRKYLSRLPLRSQMEYVRQMVVQENTRRRAATQLRGDLELLERRQEHRKAIIGARGDVQRQLAQDKRQSEAEELRRQLKHQKRMSDLKAERKEIERRAAMFREKRDRAKEVRGLREKIAASAKKAGRMSAEDVGNLELANRNLDRLAKRRDALMKQIEALDKPLRTAKALDQPTSDEQWEARRTAIKGLWGDLARNRQQTQVWSKYLGDIHVRYGFPGRPPKRTGKAATTQPVGATEPVQAVSPPAVPPGEPTEGDDIVQPRMEPTTQPEQRAGGVQIPATMKELAEMIRARPQLLREIPADALTEEQKQELAEILTETRVITP